MCELNNNNNLDEHTKTLLDKFSVEKRIDKPKFIPYNEYKEVDGEEVEVHKSPFTDFMYYKKLPEIYRKLDLTTGKQLYRYLQALFEGGIAPLVNKFKYNEEHNPSDTEKINSGGIENLMELIDPENCPDSFLVYFCKSLGLDWFPDLATTEGQTHDYYNRTFLSHIGEIIKRRGTESCIKYIAKVLTGMEVDIRYSRDLAPNGDTRARILWVDVQAGNAEDIDKVNVKASIIRRYINSQIPYYITASAVNYNLHKETKTTVYDSGYVTSIATKTVRCNQVIDTLIHVGTTLNYTLMISSNVKHYTNIRIKK